MKRIVGLLVVLGVGLMPLRAQTTRAIRQLEQQRNELKEQIAASETLLQSTKKDVKSQLADLALITGQIDERQKYLNTIESDVQTIQQEVDRLQVELSHLETELADKKAKYERSVKYMYRNKSIQEKLMFIFSAENLTQMYRRMRYVREYADFQRLQGIQVQRKQQQVTAKQRTLVASRKAKEELLAQGEAEKQKLQEQEQQRKTLVASLQKKQRSLQSELNKQRKSANKLNAQIDRLIEIEIEKARKREEERKAAEARRLAEEKRLAEARAAEARRKEAARTETSGSKEEDAVITPATPKMDAYKVDSDDRTLVSSFEKNRGALPVPITGPYVIVGHYGQYDVPGLRNVRLDNKGIDIKGQAGANARAIFDGEVSAIFQYNGLTNVLVRHGNYISVYCNLQSVQVQKGSKIHTRDIIGKIHTNAEGNTILHFQLRKETAKLNPEVWIRR
ncbi:murein hydrolase activator EnvC family protein [Phocaeicola barnesiae]|uniref:murein hydrolase activator EnvC family protein n=1 Tax=Phocaeicola barnesiae TaxID=376804 RepID=UPI000341213D|nr:peptidoglycan DD-metalloendopeptidase family protein [Phocaeicola barnesiae]MBS6469052.1 peptidoglycan DD-metalloendopeptidase family protein [Bacteroides sp.]MCF2598358.1 peptidoglycan DD-metalloendopeptidase family protein [Phocaeicola barnesiae]MDM8233836.1 peptidoglycan DD-metalloendopeptidase family protein [Phocaeicola barnesiae]CDD33600.1 peptidase M23 family [Bacteroides sp. CAG:714]